MQMMLAGALFLVFADSLLVPSTHRSPSRERSGRQTSTARRGSPPIGRRSPKGSHGASSSPKGRSAWQSPMKKAENAVPGIEAEGHGMLVMSNKELYDRAANAAKAMEEVRTKLEEEPVPEIVEVIKEKVWNPKARMYRTVRKFVLKNGTVVDTRPKKYTIAAIEEQQDEAYARKEELDEAITEHMEDEKLVLQQEAKKASDKFGGAAKKIPDGNRVLH